MERLKSKKELALYLSNSNQSEMMQKLLTNAISAVERACKGGIDAWLIISENAADRAQVEQQYNLSELLPEVDQIVITETDEKWRERIFILCDDGSGFILWERLTVGEKCTL